MQSGRKLREQPVRPVQIQVLKESGRSDGRLDGFAG